MEESVRKRTGGAEGDPLGRSMHSEVSGVD